MRKQLLQEVDIQIIDVRNNTERATSPIAEINDHFLHENNVKMNQESETAGNMKSSEAAADKIDIIIPSHLNEKEDGSLNSLNSQQHENTKIPSSPRRKKTIKPSGNHSPRVIVREIYKEVFRMILLLFLKFFLNTILLMF